MLTISSIGVGPRPPQAPVVNVQTVSPAKPSNVVSPGSSGVPLPAAPSGDGAGAQTVFARSALPPADPTREAQIAHFDKTSLPDAEQDVEAGIAAQRERFKGELPPEPKSADQERLDKQVDELIPNLWKASRAAVDALSGGGDVASAAEGGEQTAVAVAGVAYGGSGGKKPPQSPPGSLVDVRA